jgi:hypothetical protein
MENKFSENSVELVVSGGRTVPLTDYEKEIIKDTLTPTELLKQEEKEKEVEQTEEEREKQKRKDYITMVKVVSIDSLGKYALSNPSTFTQKDKNKLIEKMKEVLTWDEDTIREEFNRICTEVLFIPGVDFSKFPVYANK